MIDSNWIDIRDKLPKEDGMLVVVFDPTNHPTVWPAKWHDENQTFDSNGGWFEANEVTHWMPLPPPPKSHAWTDGFVAADRDEEEARPSGPENFTHNPHQPTSPYTYPDYHCGPATKAANDWDDGYHYRLFAHQRAEIRLHLTHRVGNKLMEFIL